MDGQYREAYENLRDLTECYCDLTIGDRDSHDEECLAHYRADVEMLLAAAYGAR